MGILERCKADGNRSRKCKQKNIAVKDRCGCWGAVSLRWQVPRADDRVVEWTPEGDPYLENMSTPSSVKAGNKPLMGKDELLVTEGQCLRKLVLLQKS
jgi:hypothetical protein